MKPQPPTTGSAAGAGTSGPAPTAGFDGVSAAPAAGAPASAAAAGGASLGPYPPIADAVKPAAGAATGYPSVAPVTSAIPTGYPGAAPPPAAGAFGAPPPPGGNPNLPAGYPGGPPAGAPGGPPGGAPAGMFAGAFAPPAGPIAGVQPGSVEDKIGPLGWVAWGLFIIGVFFPLTWVVCCFLPLLAKRAAKGPKDFMAVRRAAVAASIALCAYLVLVVILVSVGSTSWKRRVCVDRFGNRYYCS